MKEFGIEFAYEEIGYFALVLTAGPESAPSCHITLERENQESFYEIVLRASASALDDWEFQCPDGEDATQYYEKAFLEEIGEQVEARLNDSNNLLPRS